MRLGRDYYLLNRLRRLLFRNYSQIVVSGVLVISRTPPTPPPEIFLATRSESYNLYLLIMLIDFHIVLNFNCEYSIVVNFAILPP